MLTSNLKKTIDEKWDGCWPVSNLRPIAILDLISYIFFLKKLDDLDLIAKKIPDLESDNFIVTREVAEFTWMAFKDMDVQSIHDLFTKPYGIIELMNQYGQSDALYSVFFTTHLLITPTPKLLYNVIQIINFIESNDANTQSEIIEYLLCKTEKVQKEPQFLPEYISSLMVSVAEPVSKDVIWDPSLRNGSLLIKASDYILKNNHSFKWSVENSSIPKLKGMESNVSELRLAAMRMMLHGIKEPDLKIWNKEIILDENPTLIISSLLFFEENKEIAEDNLPQPVDLEKEIILLNEILQTLKTGGRAVVLVPENLLKSNLPEIQKVRKDLVENTNLEGVINLFPNSNSFFSEAGLLVFSKSETITNQVWFSKMGKPQKKRTINETFKTPDQNEELLSQELNEVNLLLDKWKKRKNITNYQRNSFSIPVYYIKTNNYNLNFNDYKLIPGQLLEDQTKNSEVGENDLVVATKKENLHQFFESAAPLERRKRKRKALPAFLLIFLLIIAGGWSYLYYFKDNKIPFFNNDTAADSVSTISNSPVHNSSIQPKNEEVKENHPLTDTNTRINSRQKTDNLSDSSQKYTVINKTWFHYAPDSNKLKTLYLEPREDLVLLPTAEENGFVYVVYINKRGQSTRGWLNKKDLEPVE